MGTPLRALIVEDSEDDEILLLRELKRGGYDVESQRVQTEVDMRAALDAGNWEVVFSDYAMPHFTGLQALEVLKQTQLDLPIILVSGTIGEDTAVAAMKAGVHDYIMKGNLARLVPALQRELRDSEVRRENRRSEVARQESEQRFRQLAENIRDVLWLSDPATERVIYVSRMYEEVWGRSCQSLYDQPRSFIESVHPDDQARVAAARKRQLEGAETREEYRVVRPDGSIRWIWDRAFPINDAAGKFFRITGIAEDITERKQILQRERDARKEAERINAMKDEFLAVLSHELRTPLTPILGWTRLLSEGTPDAAALKHGLGVIHRNLMAELRLVEDLLDVSRIVTGKMKLDLRRANVVSVVESAIEAVRPMASSRTIRLEAPAGMEKLEIVADANRLQQIVWNLISNAIKFAPGDSPVIVRLERTETAMKITVQDAGEGIDPDFVPHLFERFTQADSTTTRHHGGLGIGLALVRHLVELHGGSVTAESPGVGKGSTFTVSLPLRSEAGLKLAPVKLDGSPSLDGLKLLLVDDDPDTREFLMVALRNFGAQVTSVASAGEAFEAVKSARPDVLISDIQMPDEDGFSLIRRVRELDRNPASTLPALALTAYAKDEDRARVISAGFQSFLAKPVLPETLASAVASIAR